MSFFEELRRRNVFKVGAAYIVGAWLVAQVAQLLAESFEAPAWVMKMLLAVLALGLPLALIFGWAFELTPEGLKRDKNVDRSNEGYQALGRKLNFAVTAFLAVALAYFAWDKFGSSSEINTAAVEDQPVAAIEKSIAVLPFATRSDQQSDTWFSQGIHDDLLTQLAQIEDMKVISRTSVMRYAGTTKPIREIAQELGVATILEGGIQRAGDRVRINAQLIEAKTDTHLWAESWDKELTASNIFEIQSELAGMIVQALRSELAPGVQDRIDEIPTRSLDAYDLTLRGRYLMDKELSQENLENAVDLFRQAVAADPGYSSAWAGLSHALAELVGWHYLPESELWPEAWAAAEKAVELDANNTEALMALGDLQRMDRHYQEGEQTFLHAIDLSPGSADAHSRYSDLLRDAQRFDESVREIRRAVELDPHLIRIRESLLQNIYFSRDFDNVHEEARALLQLEPEAAGAWYWISLTQAMTGDYAAAETSMKKAIDLDPGNPYYGIGLAFVYAWDGRRDDALAIVESAEERGFSLVEIGLCYGVLGDMETAFEYMNRAFDESPAALYYIAADPSADPMRKDPRWQELLDRLEAN